MREQPCFSVSLASNALLSISILVKSHSMVMIRPGVFSEERLSKPLVQNTTCDDGLNNYAGAPKRVAVDQDVHSHFAAQKPI